MKISRWQRDLFRAAVRFNHEIVTFGLTGIASAVLSTMAVAQPTEQFTWDELCGPQGGTVTVIAAGADGVLFAGSDQNQGGVYRSVDGGLSWQQGSSGIALGDRSVDSALLADSGHVLIGTNSHIGSRIYRSTDGGATWEETARLSSTGLMRTPQGQILAINTGYGMMHRSLDNGHTWEEVAVPMGHSDEIAINSAGDMFIAGWNLARSTDDGATWTSLAKPPGNVRSIAIDAQDRVYVGNWADYGSESGIYRSTDNGDSWQPLNLGFRVDARHNIVFTQDGDILVGSAGPGVWRSEDDGLTWTQSNAGLHHLHMRYLYVASDGAVLAGTSGGGVYRSTDDGATWHQVGLPFSSPTKLAVSPAGDVFAAVHGMSRSSDAGFSWQPINTGLSNLEVFSMAIRSDGVIMVGCDQSSAPTVFRSDDNGESWLPVDSGLPNYRVHAMAVDADGNFFAGNNSGVFFSADEGATWTSVSTALDVRGIAFNSTGDMFIASWGHGFFRKNHGETEWTSLTANIGSNYVNTVFVDANDCVYAAGRRSTDNGETWTPLGLGGMHSQYVQNANGDLFAGTTNYGSGVYRSTNSGETWEQVNTGIPTGDIRALAMDDDGYLYAAAYYRGVFKSTLPTTMSTGVDDIEMAPLEFSVSQNYPNPFSRPTTIAFEVPETADVRLDVYDALGRVVRGIAMGTLQPGAHESQFDASELAPGIYFYRVRAGDLAYTKRMVVVR